MPDVAAQQQPYVTVAEQCGVKVSPAVQAAAPMGQPGGGGGGGPVVDWQQQKAATDAEHGAVIELVGPHATAPDGQATELPGGGGGGGVAAAASQQQPVRMLVEQVGVKVWTGPHTGMPAGQLLETGGGGGVAAQRFSQQQPYVTVAEQCGVKASFATHSCAPAGQPTCVAWPVDPHVPALSVVEEQPAGLASQQQLRLTIWPCESVEPHFGVAG